MRNIIATFFTSIVLLLLFFSCNNNPNKKPEVIDNTVSEERGQQVFKKNCVACHGVDGTMGLNGAANLATSTLSKEETIKVITSGRKAMLSFRGILNDKEIESAALYITKFRE
jgi:cytochrome c6